MWCVELTELKTIPSKWVKPTDPDWNKWLEICKYTRWNPEGPLVPVKYHGFMFPFNANLGVGTKIYYEWTKLINQIKALRIAIVGPAGVGKTWMAIHIARILDRKFSVDQIIFTREDYLHLVKTLKSGKVIIIEEPTYIASSRTWFNMHQQIVVRTLESSRFQNNPIIIPVVNRMLLDKTIREHYINYVIEMRDRGIGYVYRTSHDQWMDKLWRRKHCEIYAVQPGVELARCDRDTCLRCKELPSCNKYIWPKYERKREEAILKYQSEDAEKLQTKKSAGQTFKDRCDKALKEIEKYLDSKGKVSVAEVMYYLDVNRNDAQLISKFLSKRIQKKENVTISPPIHI